MKGTTANVQRINAAITEQAMTGRRSVYVAQGRVIRARTVKGQLQVRLLSSGKWINADNVTID